MPQSRLPFVALELGFFPLASQGLHDDRLYEHLDVFSAGVVDANLGAFCRVEGALKQRAENGRCYRAPIETG
ncbi:MAG: hypothetical protein NTY19_47500 [Planctomycetota bacterium]|nr:hypothetical protein [Planctomycetota bacterium]